MTALREFVNDQSLDYGRLHQIDALLRLTPRNLLPTAACRPKTIIEVGNNHRLADDEPLEAALKAVSSSLLTVYKRK